MDITREQEAQNFRRVSESDKKWFRNLVRIIKELDEEELNRWQSEESD